LDDSYSLDDQSLSPHKGGARTLHEKLSSPERYKRNRLTPEQVRLRSEERQVVAELNRDKTVEEKKLRAQVSELNGRVHLSFLSPWREPPPVHMIKILWCMLCKT
jgi:hypothetical protein